MCEDDGHRADNVAVLEVSERFAVLIDCLAEQRVEHPSLAELVGQAATAVGEAQHVQLALSHRGTLLTLAASSAFPASFADILAGTADNPAATALRQRRTVVSQDLAGDDRWPGLGSRVLAGTGIRSVVCCPVQLAGAQRGVLTFLSDWPHAFTDVGVAVASLVASYCSLVEIGQLPRVRFFPRPDRAYDNSPLPGPARR